MKITYIVGIFPKLSETFVLNQITELINRGHEIEIISISKPFEDKIHEDVDRYNLLAKTQYIVRNQTSLGFELNEKLVSSLIFTDLIHVHFAAEPTDLALKISRMLEIPFVFTAHAYDIYIHPEINKLRDKFDRADKVITISAYNKQYLLDLLGDDLKERIDVIRCGINLDKFKYVEREQKDIVKILTVGRFVEKKGILQAIETVHEVVKEYQNIELRIIGDGPLKDNIVNKIASLNLSDKIVLLGPQPHATVLKEMEEADIFLLHSVTSENGDREGIPVVLMEAQATGLPVVSTLHSGIPEAVIDGQTGFLVPERDISAMAEKLKELIRSPELRIAMGKAGRRYIERNYNQRDEMNRLEELFKTLTADKPTMTALSARHRQLLDKRIRDITVQLIDYRGDQLRRLDKIAERFEQLRKWNDEIKQKDDQLKQRDELIRQKDEVLKQKDEQFRQKCEELIETDNKFKEKCLEVVTKDQELMKACEERSTEKKRLEEELRQKDEQFRKKCEELIETDEKLKEKCIEVLAKENETVCLRKKFEEELDVKEREIRKMDEWLKQKDLLIKQKEDEIADLLNSRSWRITKPLREVYKRLLKLRNK